MTAQEAIAKLKEIKEVRGDVEQEHFAADEVLCDLLTALGYADVVEAYDAISPKYYA